MQLSALSPREIPARSRNCVWVTAFLSWGRWMASSLASGRRERPTKGSDGQRTGCFVRAQPRAGRRGARCPSYQDAGFPDGLGLALCKSSPSPACPAPRVIPQACPAEAGGQERAWLPVWLNGFNGRRAGLLIPQRLNVPREGRRRREGWPAAARRPCWQHAGAPRLAQFRLPSQGETGAQP